MNKITLHLASFVMLLFLALNVESINKTNEIENTSDTEKLLNLAKEKVPVVTNRIATVLALNGEYAEAIKLYKVISSSGRVRFTELVRLTEWALQAGDTKLAQSQAWLAVQAASVSLNRRYALSLLVESYRLNNQLNHLITQLKTTKQLSTEAWQVLIDLLSETKRYAEAIELLENNKHTIIPELKHRLLRFYSNVGQPNKMIAKYQQLIGTELDNLKWYIGLSDYYLEQNHRELFQTVWQQFLNSDQTKNNIKILLAGVERIAKAGFHDLAVSAIETRLTEQESNAELLFFLFELYQKQGKNKQANSILERLNQHLPSAAQQRSDLADAYSRIDLPQKALAVWQQLKTVTKLNYNQKLKLAALYDRLGDKEKALLLWKTLWLEQLAPARRSFIEDRLFSFAIELGQMEQLAEDIKNQLDQERKLNGPHNNRQSIQIINQTAVKEKIGLLIRLYIRSSNKVQALKTVERYLGQSKGVESLKQQVTIYRLLNDESNYSKTLRKLMKVDAVNKSDYLHELILGKVIQHDGEQIKNVRRLINELKALDPQAVGGEFEAGVLVLLGEQEAAIDAYYRAIKQAPELADNYLQLAALLKRQQRQNEAIKLLLNLAKTTDSNALFTVAIDSLLNIVTVEFGDVLDEVGRNTLKQVEAEILNRLISKGDGMYLYRLLGDIRLERGNEIGQIRVVETSLPLSGDLRANTLRQLITLTTKDKDPLQSMLMGSNQTVDHHRQLVFGRRLVALRQSMPPDVYIGLGRTFLEQQDVISAHNAINLAINMTGQLGVLEKAGDSFEQAGYSVDADNYYTRALNGDQESLSLLYKQASLKQRLGKRQEAHLLYAKAMNILLQRQPQKSLPDENTARETQQYRTYYKKLRHGFLASWLEEPEALERLNNMIIKELETLQNNHLPKMDNYPRLEHKVNFVRHIRFATDNVTLANQLDKQLLKQFPEDGDLKNTLAQARFDWGLYQSINDIGLPIKKTVPLMQSLNQAYLLGDTDKLLTLLNDWVTRGEYRQAFKWAESHLESSVLKVFATQLMTTINKDAGFAKKLIGDMMGLESRFINRVEKITDEVVFSTDELLKQITTFKIQTGSLNYVIGISGLNYLSDRLPAELFINLLDDYLLSVSPRTSITYMLNLWRYLTPKSIEPALLKPLIVRIKQVMTNNPFAIQNYDSFTQGLVMQTVHPDNIVSMQEVANFWFGIGSKKHDYVTLSLLLKSGQTEQALAEFMTFSFSLEPSTLHSNLYKALARPFLLKHKSFIEQQLDGAIAKNKSGKSLLDIKRVLMRNGSNHDQSELALLELSVKTAPNNPNYLSSLAVAYQRDHRYFDAVRVLKTLFKLEPNNIFYRAALFKAWQSLDRFDVAMQLNKHSEEDFRSNDVLNSLQVRKAKASLSVRTIALPEPKVFTTRVFSSPSDPIISRLVDDVKKENMTEIEKSFRKLWQLAVQYPERILNLEWPHSYVAPGADLEVLDGLIQPTKIFDSLSRYDFVATMLNDFIRSLPTSEEQAINTLTEYLVKAYLHQGIVKEKRQALDIIVDSGNVTSRDLTLWLMLVEAEGGKLSRNISSYSPLSNEQLLRAARLYANDGKMEQAFKLYQSLATKTLFQNKNVYRASFRNVYGALPLIKEGQKYLDNIHQIKLTENILKLVKPDNDASSYIIDHYNRLVMEAWSKLKDAKQALSHITVKPTTANAWATLSTVQFQAGQSKHALESLKKSVEKQTNTANQFNSGSGIANQNYFELVGFPESFMMMDYSSLMSSARAFSLTNNNQDWLQQAGNALNQWVVDDKVEKELCMKLLAVIAYRQYQLNNKQAANTTFENLSNHLANPKHLSRRTIDLALMVMDKTDLSLSSETLKNLALTGRLKPKRLVNVINLVAKTQGVEMAIALGQELVKYTSNDELLTQIIKLSEQSGDKKRAEKWRVLQKNAEQARKVYFIKEQE